MFKYFKKGTEMNSVALLLLAVIIALVLLGIIWSVKKSVMG